MLDKAPVLLLLKVCFLAGKLGRETRQYWARLGGIWLFYVLA